MYEYNDRYGQCAVIAYHRIEPANGNTLCRLFGYTYCYRCFRLHLDAVFWFKYDHRKRCGGITIHRNNCLYCYRGDRNLYSSSAGERHCKRATFIDFDSGYKHHLCRRLSHA